ncbi:hypothetical protein CMI37_08665 [Candidatus Pacearchaeota archaeon]|nr:hypothetical protein [Candidatus Pacearchaeota archaeon]
MQKLELRLQKIGIDAFDPKDIYNYTCELKRINDLLIMQPETKAEQIVSALNLRSLFQHLDTFRFCESKTVEETQIRRMIHLNLIIQFHKCWMLLPSRTAPQDYFVENSSLEITSDFMKKIQKRKYLDRFR